MGGSVFATPGTSAMLAGGMTFRVNWASGSPVLEYTNRAPPLPSDSWTELSQDVEQMTVVLGVTNLQADAGVPLTWFPGADGGVPIDACVGAGASGPCAVPGAWARRRSTPRPGTRSCAASARWRCTWSRGPPAVKGPGAPPRMAEASRSTSTATRTTAASGARWS